MRLEGKVALVTGASRGIGAAVCRGFAREGATVAVNYLPTADMKQLAEDVCGEIEAAGGRAIAVGADVSRGSEVETMTRAVEESLGPIDILVANAAAAEGRGWVDISEEEWDRMLAVNLKGTWLCAKAVYPNMRERGYGKIITVSSVMVELGAVGGLHYVASKAALIGFTRSLAREAGKEGIRVTCVMPGGIRTEHEFEIAPDQEAVAARMAEVQCLPQRGIAEDLVGTFVYLASNESDFVTGQVILVDGGWAHL